MHRYSMRVFWSDEDACWIATAPALGGCSAHGETASEALAELEVAIEGVLATLQAHGDPIPVETRSAAA